MKTLAIFLVALSLAGCASPPQQPRAATAALLADDAFAPPTEAITAAGLFDISPAMRAYMQSPGFRAMLRNGGRERGLVAALYAKGELKLDYDASTTRNAATTFDARSGNCLSLVIMTAAFARELGLEVTFQEVLVDELWSREGALYFASSHVNLMLAKPGDAGSLYRKEFADRTVVDFIPPADASRYRARPIDQGTIEAMYMNNRAAEALVMGRYDNAYWWARKAVVDHPSFDTAWNTLGAIYQRSGHFARAEQVFKDILVRQPNNLIAMQNLVRVLNGAGKAEESRTYAARLKALEPDPPYHYFELGMDAMKRRDYNEARKQFAREVRRAPANHEFHFWLAMANLNLGETRAAWQQLVLARDMSTTAASRRRYADKIEHLRLARESRGRR